MAITYIVGLCVLTYSSMKPMGAPAHPNLDFFGLFLVALSSGAIRPCLSTFGADQFKSNHVSMISTYFALFFLVSTVGEMMSAMFVPIFGSDSPVRVQQSLPFCSDPLLPSEHLFSVRFRPFRLADARLCGCVRRGHLPVQAVYPRERRAPNFGCRQGRTV